VEHVEYEPPAPTDLWWPNDSVEKRVYWENQGVFGIFVNENIGPAWYDSHEVTLAVVITLDSVAMFREVANRWRGPISCVLYLEKAVADYQLLQFRYDLYTNDDSLNHVRLQVVVGDKPTFPFNRLRNLAWDLVQTKWIVLWEGSFIPSMQTYSVLDRFVQKRLTDKLFVIATFETQCFQGPGAYRPEIEAEVFLPELRRYRENELGEEEDQTQDASLAVWDDEDYFADTTSQDNRFFFVSLRRLQSMLGQCTIRRPMQFNCPTSKPSQPPRSSPPHDDLFRLRPILYQWPVRGDGCLCRGSR
jgi:hypothetical protein